MYGIFKSLTKENISKHVDSYTIFKHYCDGFDQIGKSFHSPLRTDPNPSAYIINYKGDLLFKDFGLGSFRAIDFVAFKYNLSFFEALQKINMDFNLKLGEYSDFNELNFSIPKYDYSEYNKEKRPCILTIKRREFNSLDNKYWYERYRIPISTLKRFGVSAISHFSINDYLYFAHKLAYSYDYYWENEIFRRKIYQPLSTNKWFSNGGAVVQGEGMLPKSGSLLIITSSLKDVMALYELDYTAIAPTSETSFLPEQYFTKQEKRFERIVLFMDSDDTGMTANKRLSEKWKLPYIYIPQTYGAKDISDFVYKHGQKEARKMLHEKGL